MLNFSKIKKILLLSSIPLACLAIALPICLTQIKKEDKNPKKIDLTNQYKYDKNVIQYIDINYDDVLEFIKNKNNEINDMSIDDFI
ncbi:hypothetical protein FACS189459_6090 [Bacilli bacterium]|nr:hypothetical protein FACS189459_6090 [Bacilli bacterium]GHU52022.1 hypothetical protein FACS189496_1440 [Bacilli bacterium]